MALVNGRLLVLEDFRLYSVDLVSGVYDLVLDADLAKGPTLPYRMAGAVAVPGEPNQIYLLGGESRPILLQADLTTGERVVVSR